MSTTSNTTTKTYNWPAECVAPGVDPTCEPGWPCLSCCDAAGVPAFLNLAIGESPRSLGNGSGNGRSTVEPATEKQVAFLAKLVGEKLDPAVVTEQYIPELVKGGKRVVSKAIDGLVKLPRFVPAGQVEAPEFRWTKLDDEWFVRSTVPGLEVPVGTEITITKASGETSEAVVTAALEGKDGWLFRVVKAEQARSNADLPDVPAGHYAIASKGDNDLMFVRVDRPTEGKWAGRTFVKMIVGGHPDASIRGAQATDVLARIVEAGPAEAATLYGTEIGRCHVCNRTLTDEVSRSLGIGPECRKNH